MGGRDYNISEESIGMGQNCALPPCSLQPLFLKRLLKMWWGETLKYSGGSELSETFSVRA